MHAPHVVHKPVHAIRLSQPNRLMWQICVSVMPDGGFYSFLLPSDRMETGARVLVDGTNGVVRYVGPHKENGGEWVGIELDLPNGQNNGTVRGHKYFECKENHGLLVPMDDALQYLSVESVDPLKDFQFTEICGVVVILNRYTGSANCVCIPSNVVEIGSECFAYDENLSEIRFKGSILQRIGCAAFMEVHVVSIRIPKSVHVICEYCFYYSDLSEITFEEGSALRMIEAHAFSLSDLKSICIPKSVRVIEEGGFSGCGALSEITFEEGSKLYAIGPSAFESTAVSSVSLSIDDRQRICSLLFDSGTGLVAQNVNVKVLQHD